MKAGLFIKCIRNDTMNKSCINNILKYLPVISGLTDNPPSNYKNSYQAVINMIKNQPEFLEDI